MANAKKRGCLSIMAALAVLLSACAGQSAPAASSGSSSSPAAQASSAAPAQSEAAPAPAEELSLPLVQEPETLSYWISLDNWKAAPVINSYSEVAAYQEMEKLTGVQIEFIHPAIGQEAEQFNIMLASQDYPDMIFYGWSSFPGGPQQAIDDQVIEPLNELIMQNCPNMREKVMGNADIARTIQTDESVYYYFPYIHWNQLVIGGWTYQVRNDWMQENNMQLPETMEEWTAMLQKFKELGDLNQNGVADEYPLISMRSDGKERDILKWLANGFGTDYEFYQDNGTVKYGPFDEAFKDYLETIAGWYQAGYIDPEFSSMDLKQYEAKITNGQAAVWMSGLDFGRYLISLGNDEAITCIKYPVVEKGGLPIYNNGTLQGGQGSGIAITTSCKNKALAAKWIDFHYSEQGHMLLNFGVEGQSYNMVNGQPEFTDEILHNPEGLSIELALAKYCMGGIAEAFFHDPLVRYARFGTYPVQRESIERTQTFDVSHKMPPVTPTSDESQRYASIMSEVNTYMEESWTKFVLGEMTVEKDYDSFVKTLKSLGIEEALSLRQAALDRYMQR